MKLKWEEQVKWVGEKGLHTSKLKPVTEAKEEAMEAPERGSSPRWPTNIMEISCKLLRRRFTVIKGPASHSCFFTSSQTLPVSFLFIWSCSLLILLCWTSSGVFSDVGFSRCSSDPSIFLFPFLVLFLFLSRDANACRLHIIGVLNRRKRLTTDPTITW